MAQLPCCTETQLPEYQWQERTPVAHSCCPLVNTALIGLSSFPFPSWDQLSFR